MKLEKKLPHLDNVLALELNKHVSNFAKPRDKKCKYAKFECCVTTRHGVLLYD